MEELLIPSPAMVLALIASEYDSVNPKPPMTVWMNHFHPHISPTTWVKCFIRNYVASLE